MSATKAAPRRMGGEPVWSLTEMAERFALGELMGLQSTCRELAAELAAKTAYRVRKDQLCVLRDKAARLAELLDRADMPVCAILAGAVVKHLAISVSPDGGTHEFVWQRKDELTKALEHLVSTLSPELDAKLFIPISHTFAKMYAPETPLFGAEVASKFPSLDYDIEELGSALRLSGAPLRSFTLSGVLKPPSALLRVASISLSQKRRPTVIGATHSMRSRSKWTPGGRAKFGTLR